MRDLAFINLFPHYKHIKEEDLNPKPLREVVVEPSDSDQMINMIFAPDPVTGVPRSDLALVMSKDTSPQVSQFIRDTLMRPINDNSVSVDDPDLALQGVKMRRESFEDYANRLRELASKKD